MSQQFVIGHAGCAQLPIPPECSFVSHQHAIIEIDDYGNWSIRDNNSSNGVYIRNENGEYERVYQAAIRPETVVRLGPQHVNSFRFWPMHLLASDPKDYYQEFQYLKEKFIQYKEVEAQIEKKAATYGWISSMSGMIGMAGFFIYSALSSGPVSSNAMMVRMLLVSSLPPITKLLLPNSNKMLKKLREKRAKYMRCPKCFRQLSDDDLNNCGCPICKAK